MRRQCVPGSPFRPRKRAWVRGYMQQLLKAQKVHPIPVMSKQLVTRKHAVIQISVEEAKIQHKESQKLQGKNVDVAEENEILGRNAPQNKIMHSTRAANAQGTTAQCAIRTLSMSMGRRFHSNETHVLR